MLKYWIWLTTRKGLGARGAYLTTRHFATPEAAYFADETAYREIRGLRDHRPLLDKDLAPAEQILRKCYEKGIFLVTIQDAAYPQRLRALDDPPPVLYGKGILPDLNGPAVAVVGTRKASVYGLTQSRRMGYGLSRCGAVVVSGGAKGVDTEALWGALTGGSPVVAVLGCGVDVVYPAENKELFREIVSHGCLLSEYPPGVKAHREHFPVRNRIISGLSLGVLVAEAPVKSGAMITANRALEQGRDVFTLPANIGQESCTGNLELLREGAIPVRDPWEILQEYAGQFPQCLQSRQCSGCENTAEIPVQKEPEPQEAPARPVDRTKFADITDPEEQRLVALLEQGPVHIDVLSEHMQQPSGCVLALLTMLEVRGLIRRLSGRRFALAE